MSPRSKYSSSFYNNNILHNSVCLCVRCVCDYPQYKISISNEIMSGRAYALFLLTILLLSYRRRRRRRSYTRRLIVGGVAIIPVCTRFFFIRAHITMSRFIFCNHVSRSNSTRNYSRSRARNDSILLSLSLSLCVITISIVFKQINYAYSEWKNKYTK